jgi:hypothetical protein
MRSSEEDDHERQYHRSSYLPGEGVICRECYKERNFNLRAVVSYGQSIDGSRRGSRYRASACFNGDRVVGEQIFNAAAKMISRRSEDQSAKSKEYRGDRR